MGGELGGEWIHVHACLSPFAVHRKLAILLIDYTPIKNKKLKKRKKAKKVSMPPIFKTVGKGPFPCGGYFQVTEVYPFAKLKDARTAKDMLILFAYVLQGIKSICGGLVSTMQD